MKSRRQRNPRLPNDSSKPENGRSETRPTSMFQLKRILFPVDFSERSRGAAVYVEALAGRFEAELILLHVVEPPTYNRTLAEEPRICDK